MASIDQVFNELVQVNSTLISGFSNVVAATNQVNTTLTTGFSSVVAATNQVNTTLANGLATIESGISQLITLAQYEDLALAHISKQEDTIICQLDQIAKLLCALLNQSTLQTGLQGGILAADNNLTDMYASVNPEAALDLERRRRLQQEIEACCPPRQIEPVCPYEPCPAPDPLRDPPQGGQTNPNDPPK